MLMETRAELGYPRPTLFFFKIGTVLSKAKNTTLLIEKISANGEFMQLMLKLTERSDRHVVTDFVACLRTWAK